MIYRTHKGWKYGVEGRASHGAGHKLCSAGFHQSLTELIDESAGDLADLRPCQPPLRRARWRPGPRGVLLGGAADRAPPPRAGPAGAAGTGCEAHRRPRTAGPARPSLRARQRRASQPSTSLLPGQRPTSPNELRLEPGATTTLREALGRSLALFNKASGGSLLTASADLLGSTSVAAIAAGFARGYWNAATNPEARLLSIGGICEDAIAGVLSGISAYGHAIGVGSSYGAFMAPLGHIAARLHAIGAPGAARFSRRALRVAHPDLRPCRPCDRRGRPDARRPAGAAAPAGELPGRRGGHPYAMGAAGDLAACWRPRSPQRPALIAPFVTRPEVKVLDRAALGLAAPEEATTGVYLLRRPRGTGDVTIVLQESAVTYAFVTETLPLLDNDGIDPRVYYVASAELFDALPLERRHELFPEAHARDAIGVTGFTLPTLYRWVRSDAGREATLHPFHRGHYLGSGKADVVLAEAGLDGASQFTAIKKYLDGKARSRA